MPPRGSTSLFRAAFRAAALASSVSLAGIYVACYRHTSPLVPQAAPGGPATMPSGGPVSREPKALFPSTKAAGGGPISFKPPSPPAVMPLPYDLHNRPEFWIVQMSAGPQPAETVPEFAPATQPVP